jgi:iron complex outermembrane receptor protein
LNGRSNNISIRGFGPDFSQTLLNGREQTSTGDNRAVEFDQYPSEIVSQVVVFKSPTASLVGQGLVGTIDIRTVRPLDYGKSVLAVGARGTYADLGALNAGSKKYGYRANATFIDQFADDTIGIALSASYVDEPYQLQEFNAWGYAGAGTAASPAVIGGSKSYVTSTQLKRLGLNGTLQYQASDTVRMTLDGFYSNFEDDQSKRGIELPLGFGAFGTTFNPATATVNNGFVTAGTFNNVQGVVRNDIFQRKANLYSFGYNVEYEGGDGWKAFIDLGYSKTDRNELSIESYSGTGFGEPLGATDTISFVSGPSGTSFDPTLDYSNPALIRLTDPLGWGGGVVPQAGYYNNRIVEDELKQYRVGVEKEVEGFFSAIKFGMNYTDRGKSLTPDEFLVRLRGGALELAIPTNALLRPTNLSYLGLGPIVSYDARDLIADGTLVLDRNLSPDIPAKAFRVTEDLMTAYLQADIEQEMGSGTLTGNIGVQAIHTDQESSGTVFAGGVARSVRSGANYWDILPSLNLSMRFDSDFVIRFAASRQIQRPRLDDLRVAVSYGINNNAADSPTGLAPFIDGSGGNPQLRPYRANAFDLNFEKYFGQSGVISLQLFHKDVKSYIDRTRFPFDFAGYPLPTGLPPATLIGRLESSFNTGGGKLYGGELAVTLPFSNFSSALDGFGITGGVGYTKTKVKDAQGNVDQIPGYSKWVANGTAYFEKWGFNARGSVRYRSTFLGDFTGFGGSPTRRTALAEMIVDGQIGYDFQEGSALQGLSLYLQGQNLTDERFASVGASRNQVIDYQIYGRRFLAGFTYKF